MTAVILLNHSLTQEQEKGLKDLGVTKIITIENKLWGAIPAEEEDITSYIAPIMEEIKTIKPDFLVVQGESTATYKMVDFCKKIGIVALSATTKREVVETQNADGSITKQSVFKHCIFRKYF